MASTSTAVNPPTNSWYDVFLNHRGPDSKKSLASDLHRRLVLHGFRVFLDKEEMQVGDSLTSQIHAAINTASVHVAIFSLRYAESNWCLDELQWMVESGKPIIPVFYGVHPNELRWTHGDKGEYARSLSTLEKKRTHDGQPRYNATTVQNWRNVLFKVADISGLELETFNGNEVELLDKVVESVLKILNKIRRFDVAEHPTGLDEMITDFEKSVLLQQQSGKPQVIGIVGLGGIGKTTLVQELFNRKSAEYSRCCFLSDVRESARKSSLVSLQKKLLATLTQVPIGSVQIECVSEGVEMLKNRVSSSQALVILDDVDHYDQLDALLRPIRTVLQSDSLVLITSRDRDVLIRSRVEESSIYKLTGLNPQHSRELFCLHAFTQRHPHPGFEDLVEKYLNACGGLPLSLKVFGGLLYGNDDDKSFWEDHLERLEQILPDDIQKRLQISYDALQRDEKHMFLDIACFFIGKKKDTVIRIWDGSHWKGSLGFRSLQNKNLVDVVGTENEIRMHDHLRDLGRDLAKNPDLPLRIWRREDMDDLLPQSSEATEVRGIRMGRTEYEDLSSFLGGKMKKLQLLVIEDFNHLGDFNIDIESILDAVQSPNVIWLRWNTRWNTGGHSSLPWILMRKLRVLEVSVEELKTLWQEESQAPLELRELDINARLCDIPKSIGLLKHLEQIVIFKSQGEVELEKLPEEFCHLLSLKHLKICSPRLRSLPESFGNLRNLQHLDLSLNIGELSLNRDLSMSLERLPESFGNLIKLQHLDLSHCSLKRLPDSFGKLINLHHINLSLCSDLKRLPDSFGNLTNLQHLDLSSSRSLEWLSDSFGNLRRLKYLDLSWCFKLTMSNDTLGNISTLEYLSLCCFDGMEVLPSQLANQRSLEILKVSAKRLTDLPNDIGELRNLKKLELRDCYKLKCFPDSLVRLNQLPKLRISGCDGLVENGTFPYALTKLDLFNCNELKFLPDSLGRLNQLTELNISGCEGLEEVGTLPDALIKLKFVHCNELKCLPDSLGRLNQLTELRIDNNNGLEEVGTLPDALIQLTVEFCYKVKKIAGLCGLAKLRRLSIRGSKEMEEVPSIERLVSLEYLDVSGCGKVRSIRGLARLTKLRRIILWDCYELKELVGVEHLRSLEELDVSGCSNLQLPEGVDPRCIQDHDYAC